MNTQGIIFFILVIVLAAAWTAHQNPNPSGGSIFGHSGQHASSNSSGNSAEDIQNNIDKAQNQADEIQKQIEEEKAQKEASPLAQDISFSSGNADSSNPNTEYVYFTLDRTHTGTVLISGFTMRSTATGKSAVIGNGVPLIFGGQVNPTQPIYISPGDRVVVATGPSPLGYSFQLNKCSGYLTQFQNFSPSIYKQCPLANSEPQPQAPNNLSDDCLDYLDSLGRCSMPNPSTIPHSTLSESQCYNFVVDHLNYNSCLTGHKNDKDFYSHEWRVFLGYSTELWKSRRETIQLLDQNNKVIGTVEY